MTASFFFYDLETSGFNPRSARIMQFAGQRTDLTLKPLEEPHSYFIRLNEDVVPEPDAIVLTGITPQQTLQEGLTEAAFLKVLHEQIVLPNTIFVGYNSIRFDDEFMRYLHWRNFYDPYEWHWQDGSSRWDLLDVVRMTRALRPEGITWPFDSAGKPTNQLEILAIVNKLDHLKAHDALSDVQATIAVARLIQNKQSKLFDYLLSMRSKQAVAKLVTSGEPFVYTSGKYPSVYEKTTIAIKLAAHPNRTAALVYDLRYDPKEFISLTPEQLVERWKWEKEPETPRLPVKTLRYNVCPAVAPLTVLDEQSQTRLQLDLTVIEKHHQILQAHQVFARHVLQALTLMDKQQQTRLLSINQDVDNQLYDGFIGDQDKIKMSALRATSPNGLQTFDPQFTDSRLTALLPLYKGRNFPGSLSDEDRLSWETFKNQKLLASLPHYFKRLDELAKRKDLSDEQQFLLKELHLYGESIMSVSDNAP